MVKATFGSLRKMEKAAGKPAGAIERLAGEGSLEALAYMLWAAEMTERPSLTFDDYTAEIDSLTIDQLMEKFAEHSEELDGS